jgi:hypothetical protein
MFGLPVVPGDLVTYETDPCEDLAVLARPVAVLRGGVRVV